MIELEKNQNFLLWFNTAKNNGYHCWYNLSDLEEFIEQISIWYEIKYPDRELDRIEGLIGERFNYISNISNILDFNQLMYRLPDKYLNLIDCDYYTPFMYRVPLIRHNETKWQKKYLINIKRKSDNLNFSFLVDPLTGIISDFDNFKDYIGEEKIFIDDLLELLKAKYNNELEFEELEICVKNHNYDLELRNKILQLVAINILYSKKTTLKKGYQRAKMFINEFNAELGLSLLTDEIDEIIEKETKDNYLKISLTKPFKDKK